MQTADLQNGTQVSLNITPVSLNITPVSLNSTPVSLNCTRIYSTLMIGLLTNSSKQCLTSGRKTNVPQSANLNLVPFNSKHFNM